MPVVREYEVPTRFYVIDVTGYPIDPASESTKWGPPATTWAVLDRDDCHREVAVFTPRGGVPSIRCERKARQLAEELNQEDRDARCSSDGDAEVGDV